MGRCVVLMYHVVDDPRSDGEARFCCTPAMFALQMKHLADDGWRVIRLSELVSHLRAGTDPGKRTVVVTFDDGTACTREQALPILARHAFPATVFVVSSLVDRRNEWMVRDGHPARPLLSATQVRELDAAGIDVGSHTANHVWLARIPFDDALKELRNSKEQLESLLGKPVRHFAYPYGNFNREVRDAVERIGYEGACSTRWGRNGFETDRFAINRVEVMGADSLLQFRLKLHSGTHDMPPWSVPRAAVKRALQGLGMMPGRVVS